MTDKAKKIIEDFENENRLLWGDKFLLINAISSEGKDKVVLMTESLVAKLKAKLGDLANELEATSLDKDESIGSYYRVKKDETTHIHHYHRENHETERILQDLPSKEMVTMENEDGRVVTKYELMSGELVRGIQPDPSVPWLAVAVYHDFVDIAPKVLGWIKLDDKVEAISSPKLARPDKLVSLDEILPHLINLPYHWGGKSVKTGFDCSSMTQWIIYHTKGIWLPKLAKWQALVGTNLNEDEIQKGDLIFFEKVPNWSVEHVGLILGNGKMLHAFSDRRKIINEPVSVILKSRPGTMRVSKYARITL